MHLRAGRILVVTVGIAQAVDFTGQVRFRGVPYAPRSWSGSPPKPKSALAPLPTQFFSPTRVSQVLFSHLGHLSQPATPLPLLFWGDFPLSMSITSIQCLLLLHSLKPGAGLRIQTPTNQCPISPHSCLPPFLHHLLKHWHLTCRSAPPGFISLFMRNEIPMMAHPYSRMLCSHFK